MDTQFVRDRITQLRLKKGVSEYQMSYDLGHSRSYVYNISSGKSLPPTRVMYLFCRVFSCQRSAKEKLLLDSHDKNRRFVLSVLRFI